MKSYLTIPASECKKEYLEIIARSKQKFRSAELVAENGDYGSAISLLIISNEELVKALFLYFDGIGFRFREVKGMKSLFNNHKLRYLSSFVFSILYIVVQDLMRFILEVKSNKEVLKSIFSSSNSIENSLKSYLDKIVKDIQAELDFFAEIDKQRQIGLYSDSPDRLQMEKTNYETYHLKLSNINNFIIDLIEGFEFDKNNEHVKKIRDDFANKNWYLKLGDLIGRVNKPKANPYEEMKLAVESFAKDINQSFPGNIDLKKEIET